MSKRNLRTYATLRRLEADALQIIAEKREDAGAIALRAIRPDNDEAAADRERARELDAQADGCYEILELIQGLMIPAPVAVASMRRPC
ncbi:MAG: hypothetical protein ACYC4U_11220 [Pirellulaceae bacterium]